MIYLLPADFVEKVLGLEELEEEFGKLSHEQGESMIAYVPRETYKPTWDFAFFNQLYEDGKSLKTSFHLSRSGWRNNDEQSLKKLWCCNEFNTKSCLKKVQQTEKDLVPHEIAVTFFKGKTLKSNGAVSLNLKIGSVFCPTTFIFQNLTTIYYCDENGYLLVVLFNLMYINYWLYGIKKGMYNIW